MCQFFSLTSNGRGNIKYFDWEMRKKIIGGDFDYNPDSHTSINDYFGFKGAAEDRRNKYEYNPLTREFTVDQINSNDDRALVEKKVRALDFKKIVEPLIIKPIINPLQIEPTISADDAVVVLKKWASVWASVWDSVGDSVGTFVWDSVRDSVWAFVSSFFDIQYRYDFSHCVKLWENGYVPSYDGRVWRLHTINGIVWTENK